MTDSAGSVVYSASYDADDPWKSQTWDGDMTTRNGFPLTWTVDNLPASLASATGSSTFRYGPGGNRYQQVATEGGNSTTTTYIDGLLEVRYDSGSSETVYRNYIEAGVETMAANGSGTLTADTLGFFVHDEVGSVIATVTENLGGANQAMSLTSYGAWGKARPTLTAGGETAYASLGPGNYLTGTPVGQQEGYAGHEDLEGIGLVEMEGRVYDPEVGRFLSPDPNVQYPESSQGYDRYSYVNDNPMSLSDPSGYFSTDAASARTAARPST